MSRGSAAVRPASAAEVVGVRHAVLREGRPRETAVFPGDDAAQARHWVAEVDGRVVGVASVTPAPWPDAPAPVSGLDWQLRGMAVLPEVRGTGLGEALLRTAQREVAAPMWCNARLAVVGFYAREGWVPVGPPFDVPLIGPHRRMFRVPPVTG